MNSYTIINFVLWIMILFCVVIFFMYLGFIKLNSIEKFKSDCGSFGGKYWETANVTCNVRYPECASHCDLNGITYSYYDGDLCVLDCREENKNNGEVRCVC